MNTNIYYVGSSRVPSRASEFRLSNRKPSEHLSIKARNSSGSQDINNLSKSTSCPKT